MAPGLLAVGEVPALGRVNVPQTKGTWPTSLPALLCMVWVPLLK